MSDIAGNVKKPLNAQGKALVALAAVRGVRQIDEIAQEHGIDPTQVRQWAQELVHKAAALFCDDNFSISHIETSKIQLPSNQLQTRQMEANQALVLKILECQQVEETLGQSENRLRQLVAHQDHIKEEERKRIAREIHDDLGQNLLVLRIDIARLHARTAHDDANMHAWAKLMLSNIDLTIKSVRSIISDLRPFELELGLHAAIESQLKKFGRTSGVECQLSSNESPTHALSDEQTLAIFRILQESLSNVARHSGGTMVSVALGWSGRTFSMTVKDNGVGFCRGNKRKPNSFGLVAMMERVSLLGGELIIDGDSGNGTVISLSLKIKK